MADELSEQELAEIEARLDAVPGIAWHTDATGTAVFDAFGAIVAECQDPAVANLLLHVRGDLRRLLSEVRRLRAQLAEQCAVGQQAASSAGRAPLAGQS